MKHAFLALALLTAGCASNSLEDVEVVSSHPRRQMQVQTQTQTQTQVVAQKRAQEAHSLRLVGEPTQVPQPQPARVQITMQPPRTSTRQMAQEALSRVQQLEQQQQMPVRTEVYMLQVGPPVVLDAKPALAPAPVLPAPAVYPTAAPARVTVTPAQPPSPAASPSPELETADGLGYQNGGVNGTTAPPQASPSPYLPTAEGLQYRP